MERTRIWTVAAVVFAVGAFVAWGFATALSWADLLLLGCTAARDVMFGCSGLSACVAITSWLSDALRR
ncbi:MAG TPA: hypothetical protein VL551_07890 [Actinospica sp.]|jgi:hypothetical protein|nr:hypothetical protein [Actinospica sp.]